MSGPTCNDALRRTTGEGIRGKTTTDTAIVHDLDGERKAYQNLQAQLALRGYSLNELSTGNYLISRWDLTLHVSDLAAVRGFYARIGGRP